MLFEFGTYVVDIDVDKTRTFYLHAHDLTDDCTCQGCRNYVAWAKSLSAEPKYILKRMGVILEKTPEVFVNCPNDDGSLFYGGFYHLCGRIVACTEEQKNLWHKGHGFDSDEFVSLTENFRIAFSENKDLLEEGFPTPVIPMEIFANIPFLLPEKIAY
jgi:hypothetical protein